MWPREVTHTGSGRARNLPLNLADSPPFCPATSPHPHPSAQQPAGSLSH